MVRNIICIYIQNYETVGNLTNMFNIKQHHSCRRTLKVFGFGVDDN